MCDRCVAVCGGVCRCVAVCDRGVAVCDACGGGVCGGV